MSDTYRFTNSNDDDDDDDDDDEKHWYHIRSSSPSSSLNINNNFSHQLSPATIGSWGFNVNRSTNGQTLLSFTSNNNNNNNDQHKITRTTKDYNEHRVDMSSSLSSQNFQLRTPTLTRHHRHGNEFAAVDRLVLGPSRTIKSTYYPSDDSLSQQMILMKQSRINPNNHRKIQTEQELIAWQNRMLQRDQRIGHQSPRSINRRNGVNSSPSSSRQIRK
ncbi:unnamed protein product [Rotaria sp. Silwood1]|nr:unnamed protein product [Rotaria sp. Silwood1]CAF4918635.1 unnamed protein product [Rotaria sp. Silwood1]